MAIAFFTDNKYLSNRSKLTFYDARQIFEIEQYEPASLQNKFTTGEASIKRLTIIDRAGLHLVQETRLKYLDHFKDKACRKKFVSSFVNTYSGTLFTTLHFLCNL